MGYQRGFDEEVARVAGTACVNEGAFLGCDTYALSLSTTVASITNVTPAVYRVFLEGMDPALTVALKVTPGAGDFTVPSTGSPETCALFPGSVIALVRVEPGPQCINAKLFSGTGVIYLVPVVIL